MFGSLGVPAVLSRTAGWPEHVKHASTLGLLHGKMAARDAGQIPRCCPEGVSILLGAEHGATSLFFPAGHDGAVGRDIARQSELTEQGYDVAAGERG